MTNPKPSFGWLNIAAQFSEETILYLGQMISHQDFGFDPLFGLAAPRSPSNTQSASFGPAGKERVGRKFCTMTDSLHKTRSESSPWAL